jgi:two-component system, NtrC family, response regulator GlrR
VPLATVLIFDPQPTGSVGITIQRLLGHFCQVVIERRQEVLKARSGEGTDSVWQELSQQAAPALYFLLLSPELQREAKGMIQELRRRLPAAPLVLVTESVEPETMLELLKQGADDFITLPLKPFDLITRVERLIQQKPLDEPLVQSLKERLGLKQLIGESPGFLAQIRKIPVVAKSDATVLIAGETGTGKELCARAIHYLSPRASQPFVPVNCGAIPSDLVENELFGHVPGAFTGADKAQVGLIEEADGGTLLLDEVDSLPLQIQVKLLRFLQEKEYKPLGASRARRADVRILAAANTSLEEQVRRGRLRQDLYYRLNVIPLRLPPLRERPQDILPLTNFFLIKYAEVFGKGIVKMSPEATQILLCYHWPGNVRELEHLIERTVLLSEQPVIQVHEIELPDAPSPSPQESFQKMKAHVVAQFEKSCIQGFLLTHQGNITKAAQAAGKNRRAFFQLMRKHHITARHLRVEI